MSIDYCAQYQEAYRAYMTLIAGKNAVEVRHGDRWVTYGKGDAKSLLQEVRRLECMCNGGPQAFHTSGPRPLLDHSRYRGFPWR